MKGRITVLGAVVFALVAAAPAEAAKTSEEEGRKYSRKHVRHFVGQDFPDYGWKQRECWRIGRRGAGLKRVLPRGVVCRFSSTYRKNVCWLLNIAVKDKRRGIVTQQLYERSTDRRADPSYCNREPDPVVPPKPLGAKGNPL